MRSDDAEEVGVDDFDVSRPEEFESIVVKQASGKFTKRASEGCAGGRAKGRRVDFVELELTTSFERSLHSFRLSPSLLYRLPLLYRMLRITAIYLSVARDLIGRPLKDPKLNQGGRGTALPFGPIPSFLELCSRVSLIPLYCPHSTYSY